MEKKIVIENLSVRELYSVIVAASLAPALVSMIFMPSVVTGIFAFIIALAHTAFFGVPFFLVLANRGGFTWWHAMLGGFSIGALPLGLITLVTDSSFDLKHLLFVCAAGGFGFIGGVVGWLAMLLIRKQRLMYKNV